MTGDVSKSSIAQEFTNVVVNNHTGSCPTVFTIRYDTRCYFNVRSNADISQLNLPHGTDN